MITVVTVTMAAASTCYLAPLRSQAPFSLFFAAVMLSAWFGGLRIGLFATVLSALAVELFVWPARGAFAFDLDNAMRIAVFLVVAALISALTAGRRRVEQERSELALREQAARDQASAEARFRKLLESAPDAIVIVDRHGRIVIVNSQAERIFGYSRAEMIGQPVEMLMPGSVRQLHQGHRDGYFADPRTRPMGEGLELFGQRKDGSRFPAEISLSPLENEGELLITSVIRDITERKRAERQRAQLASEKAARAAAEAAQRRMAFLAEASVVLASSLDYTATLTNVARLAVPRLADWCAVDMLHDDGSMRRLAVAHVDPEKVRWATQVQERFPHETGARHGVPKVIRNGKSEFYPEVTDDLLVASARNEEELAALREVGIRSIIIAPMIARGRTLGAITFVHSESGHRYEAEDLALAEDLARRAAIAVDNARLYYEAQQELAERTRAQEALAQNQAEIEALNERLRRAMTETHHRVKNNLQIIAAMVDMQLMEGKPVISVDDLKRLGAHVHMLAVVHDILTREAREDGQAHDLSARALLERLLPMLEQTVGERGLRYEIEDLRLSARQGTSLAIVMNELVSNAIKHGRGAIEIRLAVTDHQAELAVSDRGPGFPPDFNPEAASNTGLELVESLSHWDLGGSTVYENAPGGGARVRVQIPLGKEALAAGTS